jgi:hypothetical protein
MPGATSRNKFRALFEETRARWLGDCAAIGIAHKAHRLRCQQRLAEMAEELIASKRGFCTTVATSG